LNSCLVKPLNYLVTFKRKISVENETPDLRYIKFKYTFKFHNLDIYGSWAVGM